MTDPAHGCKRLPRVLEHVREVTIIPLGAAGRRGRAETC